MGEGGIFTSCKTKKNLCKTHEQRREFLLLLPREIQSELLLSVGHLQSFIHSGVFQKFSLLHQWVHFEPGSSPEHGLPQVLCMALWTVQWTRWTERSLCQAGRVDSGHSSLRGEKLGDPGNLQATPRLPGEKGPGVTARGQGQFVNHFWGSPGLPIPTTFSFRAPTGTHAHPAESLTPNPCRPPCQHIIFKKSLGKQNQRHPPSTF